MSVENISSLRIIINLLEKRIINSIKTSNSKQLAQVIYKPHCHYQNFSPLTNRVYLIAIIDKTPLRNGNCPVINLITQMGVAHTVGHFLSHPLISWTSIRNWVLNRPHGMGSTWILYENYLHLKIFTYAYISPLRIFNCTNLSSRLCNNLSMTRIDARHSRHNARQETKYFCSK